MNHADSEIATSGQAIRMVLLAHFDQAVKLLENPSSGTGSRGSVSSSQSSTATDGVYLLATRSFVAFMQALVTYESDKISQAIDLWRRTEKLCSATLPKDCAVEDKLERRILSGDAKICTTFLQLLQSADFTGIFKGSWSIRQAWKLYQTSYDDILKLIDAEHKSGRLSPSQVVALTSQLPAHKMFNISTDSIGKNPPINHHTKRSSKQMEDEEDDDEFHDASSEPFDSSGEITSSVLSGPVNVQYDRIHQVLGSVCYGFGCFHLMLSLLPSNLLKWLKFLGFEGDLQTGMKALSYCMNSPDSKALLARITLIWFHTVIQTYYAVKEEEVEEGISRACFLLNGLDNELRDSPLVRFFDCRLRRFRKDVDGAIDGYCSALAKSTHVKDFNVLIHHEFGILRFQLQEWDAALEHLNKCFHEGRWGKSLYAYLTGLCHILSKNVKKGRELIGQVAGLNMLKNAPLEMFLADRSGQFLKETASMEGLPLMDTTSLLALEMTYFLNCPQYIPDSVTRRLIRTAEDATKMDNFCRPLAFLMLGRLVDAQDLSDPVKAEKSYREAIKYGDGSKGSGEHIAAFGCYELGVLLSRNPQTVQEGKEYLRRANDSYKNCHFRNRLHVRIHLARKAFEQS